MFAASEREGGPEFDWPLAYAAERFLRRHVDAFLAQNEFSRRLAHRMLVETGTDFFEWIDHIALPREQEGELLEAGFNSELPPSGTDGEPVYQVPRTTLPRVRLDSGLAGRDTTLALRSESLEDFVVRHHLSGVIEGDPFSRYRRCLVSRENGATFEVNERRAYCGFATERLSSEQMKGITTARELWQTRPRRFSSEADGFANANQILDRVLEWVGADLGCHLFFETERAYWESRNRAARLQKHRQDQLGLGWGNHDHHTYRCSREHFVDLLQFLLRLGFHKRERYYVGGEAGWGAQICEQPTAGIVVFADVDLLARDIDIDFSACRLPPAPSLGTVGLWVGLHGESFLEAGMHHLEARFDFNHLRDQLRDQGITTMKPFSDFEFLRQAFTEGERWPVRPERAERLLATGLITRDQCEAFVKTGAVGSHLENLQRHGGFKGFNQKSVSAIIAATDPRHLQSATARSISGV